jgi:hypothetical protein
MSAQSTLPAPPDNDVIGYMPDGEGGWLELYNEPSKTTRSRPVLCACGQRATAQCDGGVFMCAGCERTWHLGVLQ